MIKYFCDVCKAEMKDLEEGGSLISRKKVVEFIKHNAQNQIREIKYLFCPDCSEKIVDYKKKLEGEVK